MRNYKWIVITVVLALGVAGTGYFLSQQTVRLREAKSQIATLENKVSSLQANISSLISSNDSLKTQLDFTKTRLDSTNSELDSTKTQLESTKSELSSIKQVYPPRHFNSYNELRAWLGSSLPELDRNLTVWKQALQLQTLALKKGVIISVSPVSANSTIIVVLANGGVSSIAISGASSNSFIITALAGDKVYNIGLDGTTSVVSTDLT